MYDVPDVFCHLYDIAIASMPKFASSSYYSHCCISLDIFGTTCNKISIPSSQFWSRYCFFIVYWGIIIEPSMNAPFWVPKNSSSGQCLSLLEVITYCNPLKYWLYLFLFTLMHTSRSSTHLLTICDVFWLRKLFFHNDSNECWFFFFCFVFVLFCFWQKKETLLNSKKQKLEHIGVTSFKLLMLERGNRILIVHKNNLFLRQ